LLKPVELSLTIMWSGFSLHSLRATSGRVVTVYQSRYLFLSRSQGMCFGFSMVFVTGYREKI